mgnify:CR=1 FL=1
MFILDILQTGSKEYGNMTQLEVFEKILVDGGKDYNKTITDRDIIIQIVMYNDILVFHFNHDGTINHITET